MNRCSLFAFLALTASLRLGDTALADMPRPWNRDEGLRIDSFAAFRSAEDSRSLIIKLRLRNVGRATHAEGTRILVSESFGRWSGGPRVEVWLFAPIRPLAAGEAQEHLLRLAMEHGPRTITVSVVDEKRTVVGASRAFPVSPVPPLERPEDPAAREAVRSLEAVGATIEVDASLPGAPVAKVSLHKAKIGDNALRRLSAFSSLRALDLSWTDISDEGLKHLRGLTQLETLNLGFTRIGDDGVAHLRELTNLKHLDLNRSCKRGRRLTDRALNHILALRRLERLDLDWNRLSETGMLRLRELQRLERLFLGVQIGIHQPEMDHLLRTMRLRMPGTTIS